MPSLNLQYMNSERTSYSCACAPNASNIKPANRNLILTPYVFVCGGSVPLTGRVGPEFCGGLPVSVLGVADLEWLKVFGSTVFIGLYAATIDVTRAR